MATKLTGGQFHTQVAESPTPLLVEFYGDGCAACRAIAPMLRELEEEYAGRLAVAKVNAGAEAELADSLEILSLPTLLLYREGREQYRHSGMITKEALAAQLQLCLEESQP